MVNETKDWKIIQSIRKRTEKVILNQGTRERKAS